MGCRKKRNLLICALFLGSVARIFVGVFVFLQRGVQVATSFTGALRIVFVYTQVFGDVIPIQLKVEIDDYLAEGL